MAEANQKTEAAQRENELGARYSAEITKLNSNLDEKTASLNSMTTRASCAEETIAALRREVDYLKDRVRSSMQSDRDGRKVRAFRAESPRP